MICDNGICQRVARILFRPVEVSDMTGLQDLKRARRRLSQSGINGNPIGLDVQEEIATLHLQLSNAVRPPVLLLTATLTLTPTFVGTVRLGFGTFGGNSNATRTPTELFFVATVT